MPDTSGVMKSSGSVEIDKPIEAVFEYTNNNVADWSSIVVEDEVIEEKNGGGVGTTFRSVTEDRGRRMEFAGTVTEYERPTLCTVVLVGDAFDIEAAYHYEALDEGRTRVTQKSNVTPKGFIKVFFFLFGWLMKKGGCDAQQRELENLKQKCEALEG
ncbi:MAG: SRPBCC family protein [Verrucomicrobia subdivision 3 bacterium]|nr:SRPBCC family protein [Limisphaerales bacterium]